MLYLHSPITALLMCWQSMGLVWFLVFFCSLFFSLFFGFILVFCCCFVGVFLLGVFWSVSFYDHCFNFVS